MAQHNFINKFSKESMEEELRFWDNCNLRTPGAFTTWVHEEMFNGRHMWVVEVRNNLI